MKVSGTVEVCSACCLDEKGKREAQALLLLIAFACISSFSDRLDNVSDRHSRVD